MNDLRFAVRQLARSPRFTAMAVVTLAVGIGGCAAIFSVVDAVLLRPLPFPEPDRVLVFKETLRGRAEEHLVASAKYLDWQKQARSFDSIAAYTGVPFNLTGAGDPIRPRSVRLSINALPTLRVNPLLGRNFRPEEEPDGTDNIIVAILSHDLWQRQFGGRRDVVGQVIQLNDKPVTVVGVLPRATGLPEDVELFVPLGFPARQRTAYDGHWLRVFGRLKPGVTIAQAQSEMSVIAERTAQAQAVSRGWGVKLHPMVDTVVGEVRPVLLALLGAVGLLLLIACANVANLLLARAIARSKEIAVRAALGASRGRIIRQLLVESVLLSLLGSAAGLLLAYTALPVLLELAPETLPRAQGIGIDSRVLAFTVALAVLTGLAFGVTPALQANRGRLPETLKQSARGTTQGASHQRLGRALVVGEVAVALVLLAGAGLLMRSFVRLLDVNPGFNPRDAIAASVYLQISLNSPTARAQSVAFSETAVGQLAALPGVQSAAVVSRLPFGELGQTATFEIPGRSPAAIADRPVSSHFNVGPDYFRVMGIPLLRGRVFESRDTAEAPPVAVINQSLAKRFFPGEDPLGKAINLGRPNVIVGIVGDIKADRLDGEVQLQTYLPFAQAPPVRVMNFVVRTAGNSAALIESVRRVIAKVDPAVPARNVRPLETLLDASLGRQRYAMTLFGVFSAVALLLTAMGIYSVLAYSVARRTGEIGIRMALGAQSRQVLRMVLLQGGRLVAVGAAVGLVAALSLTRFLEELLYDVRPWDPTSIVVALLLLAAVACLACLLPARRASRVNPMVALQSE